ncbi:hypothetical protein [Nonomuraea sp. NPDC049480]|uniref:hypothetical protein n=1 Tax=Nonomuraea sp. NPDC049480 TaxID=3364353 RepID=UPI0037A9C574
MTTTAWDEIRHLIDLDSPDDLVDRLIKLNAAERELVAAELRDHVSVLRARAEAEEEKLWSRGDDHSEIPRSPWQNNWPELLRLTGADDGVPARVVRHPGPGSATRAQEPETLHRTWSEADRPSHPSPAPRPRRPPHRSLRRRSARLIVVLAFERGDGAPGSGVVFPLERFLLRHPECSASSVPLRPMRQQDKAAGSTGC